MSATDRESEDRREASCVLFLRAQVDANALVLSVPITPYSHTRTSTHAQTHSILPSQRYVLDPASGAFHRLRFAVPTSGAEVRALAAAAERTDEPKRANRRLLYGPNAIVVRASVCVLCVCVCAVGCVLCAVCAVVCLLHIFSVALRFLSVRWASSSSKCCTHSTSSRS